MLLYRYSLLFFLIFFVQSQAVELPSIRVESQTIPRYFYLDGEIEAVTGSVVSAQTSGRIVQVFFDVDDVVKAGDLLIRLDGREQQAAVNAAQAQVNEARAFLNNAEQEFNRQKELQAKGLTARSAYDRAEAEVGAARARLAAAQAQLAQAREQLGYTEIRAPYAGTVKARLVEVGESVSPGTPLMEGIGDGALRVITQVPQRLLTAARQHRDIAIITDAGVLQDGQLTFFPYADSGSRSFRLRITLPKLTKDFTDQLFPGMMVKVRLRIGEQTHLVVPESALVQRGEVTALYVLNDDQKIALRYVRPGKKLPDGRREIMTGLRAGERVILDPIAAGIALKAQQKADPKAQAAH
jgi:RND family efflux transporter MFP subunit